MLLFVIFNKQIFINISVTILSMLNSIKKLFIKENCVIEDSKEREKVGTAASIFSIVCNIILVSIKLFAAFLTNSVSIKADAFNNLSDAGSNIATLFGFKLASKHADGDHPYGHGRMEYLSGLVIACLILVVGVTSIVESAKKITDPQSLNVSMVSIILLVVSIMIKMVMYFANKNGGNLIDSTSLKAAAQDSLNDCLTTFATLVAIILHNMFNIHADAYIGIAVSALVLKSGIDIFKDVLDTILGKAPDKEFVDDIQKYVMSNEKVLGIHDLMYHDYGPASKFITLHAEVDYKNNILDIHDEIDNIEKGILEKFNVVATIHMDPIVTDDEELIGYKNMVHEVIKEMNSNYKFHDFRMVKGPTHTNLVFDLVLPVDDKEDHENVRKELERKIKERDSHLNIVVEIEHSFVD